jgi:hypothetical protein
MKEQWGGRNIALQHNKVTCREQRFKKNLKIYPAVSTYYMKI